MSLRELRTIGLLTIRELETENGILASDRTEIFGCIFGRDSLITSLKLLSAYRKTGETYFLSLVRKILLNLAQLQGTTFNIESGEEKGKIIHEFRESNHEHLTVQADRPWYVYPDNTMKNYDSVDSTALFLVTTARYLELIDSDDNFEAIIQPSILAALDWARSVCDRHSDGFVSYWFHPDRTNGGLSTQSWMDSGESVFHEDGSATPYPIAPVEVQAYTYLAFRLWAKRFNNAELDARADYMKERFNKKFILENSGSLVIPFGIDGQGRPMRSARSSIGHLLWAATQNTGTQDSIIANQFIPALVSRILAPDLFVPTAGIRTLSSASLHFDPASYHNGSIWPHDTSMIAEGLENFGYTHEATRVRESLRQAWSFFKTPIELYTYTDDGLREYASVSGQKACKKQAWTAASMLADL